MALAETFASHYLRGTNQAIKSQHPEDAANQMTAEKWAQWYQEQLSASGLSGEFLDQAGQNPYATYQDVPLNFFEQLWKNMTGVSAKEQDFYNQRQQAAQEYLAQLKDAQRQQQYNDPAAQLAREKAAGLNPELNGGQNLSAGQTAGAAPDDTPPNVQGTGDEVSQVGSIMSLGFSLFQNAFSVIGSMQQIYGNSLQNSEKEMALTDQGWNQLIKLAAESSSWDVPAGKPGKSVAEMNLDDFDMLMGRNMEQFYGRLSRGDFANMYDRKTTRKFMSRLQSLLSENGQNSLGYKKFRSQLMKEIVGNTESAAEGIGKYGFSDNILVYGQQIAETFGNIEKEARKAASRFAEAQATSAEAQAGYNAEYYSPELGQEEGAAAAEEARMRKVQAKLDSYIDQQLDSLISSLQQRGDMGSLILTFLIASIRSVVKSAAGSMSFGTDKAGSMVMKGLKLGM